MNMITQQTTQSQQKEQKSLNIRALLSSLPPSVINLFFKIRSLNKHYKLVYTSQAKMALLLRYSRCTINQAAIHLEELGLLDIERRQSKTHIYHIPEELCTMQSNKILDSFYKTFRAFSFITLCSIPAAGRNPTQLVNKDITNKSAHASPMFPVRDLSKMFLTAHLWTKKPSAEEIYAQTKERRTWPPRKYTQTKAEIDFEVSQIIGDRMYDYSDKQFVKPKPKPIIKPLKQRELTLAEHKQNVYERARQRGIDIDGLTYGEITRRLSGYSREDRKIAPPDEKIPPLPKPPVFQDWNAIIPKRAYIEEAEATAVYEMKSVSDNLSPFDFEAPIKAGHGPFDEEIPWAYGDLEEVLD